MRLQNPPPARIALIASPPPRRATRDARCQCAVGIGPTRTHACTYMYMHMHRYMLMNMYMYNVPCKCTCLTHAEAAPLFVRVWWVSEATHSPRLRRRSPPRPRSAGRGWGATRCAQRDCESARIGPLGRKRARHSHLGAIRPSLVGFGGDVLTEAAVGAPLLAPTVQGVSGVQLAAHNGTASPLG